MIHRIVLLYMASLLIFSLLIPVTAGKSIPGGPAISIFGNIISGIMVVFMGIPLHLSWRKCSPFERICVIATSVILVALFALHWWGTYDYYSNPVHRGTMFGI